MSVRRPVPQVFAGVRVCNDFNPSIPKSANRGPSITTSGFPIDPMLKYHYVQQVLELTCDILPGDHTFSIFVEEMKAHNGKINRSWHVVNQ